MRETTPGRGAGARASSRRRRALGEPRGSVAERGSPMPWGWRSGQRCRRRREASRTPRVPLPTRKTIVPTRAAAPQGVNTSPRTSVYPHSHVKTYRPRWWTPPDRAAGRSASSSGEASSSPREVSCASSRAAAASWPRSPSRPPSAGPLGRATRARWDHPVRTLPPAPPFAGWLVARQWLQRRREHGSDRRGRVGGQPAGGRRAACIALLVLGRALYLNYVAGYRRLGRRCRVVLRHRRQLALRIGIRAIAGLALLVAAGAATHRAVRRRGRDPAAVRLRSSIPCAARRAPARARRPSGWTRTGRRSGSWRSSSPWSSSSSGMRRHRRPLRGGRARAARAARDPGDRPRRRSDRRNARIAGLTARRARYRVAVWTCSGRSSCTRGCSAREPLSGSSSSTGS